MLDRNTLEFLLKNEMQRRPGFQYSLRKQNLLTKMTGKSTVQNSC